MMHHKAIRTFGNVGVGIFCGVMSACAGGDTPARNDDIEIAISDFFGSGQVGANTGGSGAVGAGGSQGGSGNGGADDNGGSANTGGSAPNNGGDGGDDVAMMGGSGGGDLPACDGFQILKDSCGSGGCHGAGAPYTPFAASLEDAADWVDKPAAAGCASNPASVFDPGNPSESLVILKLAFPPPCGSSQMPITAPGSITPEQITCIEEFIQSLE